MRVLVFSKRPDETEYFEHYGTKFGLELFYTSQNISIENIHLTKGCDAVNIAAAGFVSDEVAKALWANGVKYIVTRTAGYNHIDLAAVKAAGLKASYVPSYSPNAISEHTLMLALNLLRHTKSAVKRIETDNFTLSGLRGREIRKMTAGIIGTGQIGFESIKAFRALGANVMAYDVQMREEVKAFADYLPIEALYKTCDILSFHCPLTASNYHLVNEESISKMKDGVCLINTARGELFDYQAVLKGLKTGKIGALGFDVYEHEEKFMRRDLKGEKLEDETFKELIKMEQVLFTPHIAFYTDEAVANMVGYSLENLYEYNTAGNCKNELID